MDSGRLRPSAPTKVDEMYKPYFIIELEENPG